LSDGLQIVLCPDSFKGSLDATTVAAAMARGVHAACPTARVHALPMADGGEGSARLIAQALGWEWQLAEVHGPTGERVTAGWGLDSDDRRAVIDVASACGLDLVPPDRRDPRQLDSRGVGELMSAAMDAGIRQLMIGLGGSGTVDGGAGMLAALGLRFLDGDGDLLPPAPAELATLAAVDGSGLDPRLAELEIILLSDVDNPLIGPDGASAVFGPQKGLAEADIEAMDAHLARLAKVFVAANLLHCPTDTPEKTPGAGAAGGLGFALNCVLGGSTQMGASCIADLIGLNVAIARADWVITGEGQIDGQTLRGKVVAEVIGRAQKHGVPVAAVAGRITASREELAALGLADARALCDGSLTLEQAMAEPARWIATRTEALMRTICERRN